MLAIHFDPPGVAERQALWERLLPSTVSIDRQPDRRELATRYDLTGGEIKAAVVGAFIGATGAGSTMLRLADLIEMIKLTEQSKRIGMGGPAGFRVTT